MIWAIAVIALGCAAIFHGDTSSTYGPKLILLGLVFVALGAVFLIADLITLAL
jgi:hypothetical protein